MIRNKPKTVGGLIWLVGLICIITNVVAQNGIPLQTTLEPLYPGITPVCDCKDLSKVSIPNTIIEYSEIDSEGEFCKVTAIVNHPPSTDQVRVWIGLPLKNWNGRFYGTGGSGNTGGFEKRLNREVSQGFVTGATNAGHDGGSGDFVYDTENKRLKWQEIRDFAYMGIHDMAVVGKTLAQAFYGKPVGYSYFVGNSTGGRQGITSAQRYPDDYDGITAGCPALNTHIIRMIKFWPYIVMKQVNNFVSKEKLEAVTKAAVLACDGDDGVVDGVIDDPLHCIWDPKAFVGTTVGDAVFTEADADVVRKIWDGPHTLDGNFMWYPFNRGSNLLMLEKHPIALDWVRYSLLLNPEWDSSQITRAEFELLYNQSIDQYGKLFRETPDLSGFRDSGGKIIIFHGLADQSIPAQGTIRLYEQMGGAKSVSAYARLFLVPGVNHGFRGEGAPSPVNTFTATVRWVEEGKPPEKLQAELKDEKRNVICTRPLFPYPNVARYKGTGSTDESANFKKVSIEYEDVLFLEKYINEE